MGTEIEYLVVTTGRENMDFLQDMNIKGKTVVTNQSNHYSVDSCENAIMVTTPTKGVGVNRNLGLSLAKADYSFIVDDDMVFYDNANEVIERALKVHSDADVIIFNFDYVKDNKVVRPRMKKAGSINIHNCLNYGICCTLVKNTTIQKHNTTFSTLFGGGCIYSCGEDSLFFLECVRNGLRIYTYLEPVGRNEYRESSWFTGYNEKFFFDKGAWIACAFKRMKHLMKWYFVFRLHRFSELPIGTIVHQINAGINGFEHMAVYNEEKTK